MASGIDGIQYFVFLEVNVIKCECVEMEGRYLYENMFYKVHIAYGIKKDTFSATK
jgi:hypothetical protein